MSRVARLIARWTAALVSLAIAAAPTTALACSVCIGTQNADTQTAYRAMTAFMTFTPIAIVGAVIYWIYRRFKALDAEETLRAHGVERSAPSEPIA